MPYFLVVKLGVSVLIGLFIVLVIEPSNLTKSLKKVRPKKKCSRTDLIEEWLGSLSEPTRGCHVVESSKETI